MPKIMFYAFLLGTKLNSKNSLKYPYKSDTMCVKNQLWHLLGFWRASLVTQMLKNAPAALETWVQSLGWEDPLEKGFWPVFWIPPVFWSGNPMDCIVHGVTKMSQLVRYKSDIIDNSWNSRAFSGFKNTYI